MTTTAEEAQATIAAECDAIQSLVRAALNDPEASVTRPRDLFADDCNTMTLVSRGITVAWKIVSVYTPESAALQLAWSWSDENDRRRAMVTLATRVVSEQAADARLWFVPETITERALLNALRRLHAAVEGDAEMVATLDPGPNE